MNMYDGNVIRLRLCRNSHAQKWFYNSTSGKIHNKLNNTFCLACRGGRTGTWDGLELWECADDSSKWLLTGGSIANITINNSIVSCITLQEGTAKEAQMLRLQPCFLNSNAQQWERI